MKKLMMSLVVAMCLLSACDEKKLSSSDVPEPARTSFATQYPGATEVEWKTEKDDGKTIYEAKFKKDGKEIEAEFNADGTFIKED